MYCDFSSSNPYNESEYYNNMQGKWTDGSNLVYGGDGHQSNAPTPLQNTKFAFPGDGDQLNWGTTNSGAGNNFLAAGLRKHLMVLLQAMSAGERRIVHLALSNTDNIQEFSLAYITNDSVSNTNSVNI